MRIATRKDLLRLADLNPDEPRARDAPPPPEMPRCVTELRAMCVEQDRVVQQFRTTLTVPWARLTFEPSAPCYDFPLPDGIWEGTVEPVNGDDVRAIRAALESKEQTAQPAKRGRKPTASRLKAAEAGGAWLGLNGPPVEHGDKADMVRHMLKACRDGLSPSVIDQLASEIIAAYESCERAKNRDR